MLALSFGLTGCVKAVNVRIQNDYPFDVTVSVVHTNDNGLRSVEPLGAAPTGQNTLFEAAIREGTPVYDLQFPNRNGKIVREVRETYEQAHNDLNDRTWRVNIGP